MNMSVPSPFLMSEKAKITYSGIWCFQNGHRCIGRNEWESKSFLLQSSDVNLTRGVPCSPSLDQADLGDNPTPVDGQALICAIGKPQQAGIFGDLANVFNMYPHHAGRGF